MARCPIVYGFIRQLRPVDYRSIKYTEFGTGVVLHSAFAVSPQSIDVIIEQNGVTNDLSYSILPIHQRNNQLITRLSRCYNPKSTQAIE